MKNYRIGGGLQVIQNGYLIGPVRGPSAPRKPSCMDISAGLMEPDEGMKSTQVREGAEEAVRINNGDVYLPETVKEAEVTEQVASTIAEAIEDENSPFEHGFNLKFYDSRVEVPTNLEESWIQGHSIHDWETGVTVEEDNTPSYELVNYIVEEAPSNVNPIDTEVIQNQDETNMWLDRMVYKFHPIEGDAEIYRSGHKIYSGDFSGMIEKLESELGQKLSFTDKLKASLEGLPVQNQKIYDGLKFDSDVRSFFNINGINNS